VASSDGVSILVTGGCGFIGSALVLHLRRARPAQRVVTLDKLTYAGNLESLASLEGDPQHRFILGDVCDAQAVEALFAQERFEAVFHLAAESHVDRSLLEATAFVRTNVEGTQVLLDAARRHGVGRFVHVSTDEVYGAAPEGTWFTEQAPLRPSSPYGASKASADLLAAAAHRAFGQDVVITRCTNNLGPRQLPEKLIPLMITRALQDQPLPVYGDGLQRRNWLHVDDHVQALVAAWERGQPGAVYNLAGDTECSNLEVVQRILRTLGKPPGLIQHVADRPGHDRRYALDDGKARGELDWRPHRPLEGALEQTIQWYVEQRAWWERVLSGEYQRYFDAWYGPRLKGGR
jgi:dTDP-glucose 4,6-dehydratase